MVVLRDPGLGSFHIFSIQRRTSKKTMQTSVYYRIINDVHVPRMLVACATAGSSHSSSPFWLAVFFRKVVTIQKMSQNHWPGRCSRHVYCTWDNGQDNENYYSILSLYRGDMGIMRYLSGPCWDNGK